MKQILLFFIALLLYTNLIFAQEQKNYYSSGELENVGMLKNGEKTGEWKYYQKKGLLKLVMMYENGKITGKY